MALLKKSTSAQYPLRASFEFLYNDTMVDIAGATSDFNTTGKAFDVIPLPYGAQLHGGELIVKTASNAVTTHTCSVGDSASATRYGATIDLKTAARTALTLTGYVSLGEALRLTIAQTGGAATAGKFQVMIEFSLAGTRANENLKTT